MPFLGGLSVGFFRLILCGFPVINGLLLLCGLLALNRLFGGFLRLVLSGMPFLGGLFLREALRRHEQGKYVHFGAERIRVGDHRVGGAVAVRVGEHRRAVLQRPAGKPLPLRGGGVFGRKDRVPVTGLQGGQQRVIHDEAPGHDAVPRRFSGIGQVRLHRGQFDVGIGLLQGHVLQFHDLRFKVDNLNLRLVVDRIFKCGNPFGGFFRKRERRRGKQQRDQQRQRPFQAVLHMHHDFLPRKVS